MTSAQERPFHYLETTYELPPSQPHIADRIITHLLERIERNGDINLHGIAAGKENPIDTQSNGRMILAVAPTNPIYEAVGLHDLIQDIFPPGNFPDMKLEAPKISRTSLKGGKVTFVQNGHIVLVPQYNIDTPNDRLLRTVGIAEAPMMPTLPKSKEATNQQIITVLFFPHDALAAWVQRNYKKKDAFPAASRQTEREIIMRGNIPLHILEQYKQGNYLADL